MSKRPIAGLVVAALLLTACGGPADDRDVAETAQEVAATAEALDEMDARLRAVESDLASEADALKRVSGSLDSLEKSFERSLDKIRATLRELRTDLASGRGDIESALGQVGSLTRDLAVLDQRLDYHLRNHGGG